MEVGDKVIYTNNISFIETRLLKRPIGTITGIRECNYDNNNVIECDWELSNGVRFHWNVLKKYIKQIK